MADERDRIAAEHERRIAELEAEFAAKDVEIAGLVALIEVLEVRLARPRNA